MVLTLRFFSFILNLILEEMMKRGWILICTVLLLVSGCKAKEATKPEGLKIVASNFPLYDFARQIVGDEGEVNMLLPPGTETHSYDPSPGDIIQIQEADLFLLIGGESDTWMEEVLSSMDKPEGSVLKLIDCVVPLEEETMEGMTHQHDEEEEGEYDEHIWTSQENAVQMVEAISKAVSELAPEKAKRFEENTVAYVDKLRSLQSDFQAVVDEGNRKTLLFGDRFPFLYFAKEYGLTCFAAFPGCSAETEPSAATVAFLIDKIKTESIPVILYPELSNHKVADILAESTGTKTMEFHSCHTVTQAEVEHGETYLSLMEKNVETLKEALR